MCNYAARVVVIVLVEDGNKVFKKLLSFNVVVGQNRAFFCRAPKCLQIFARIA